MHEHTDRNSNLIFFSKQLSCLLIFSTASFVKKRGGRLPLRTEVSVFAKQQTESACRICKSSFADRKESGMTLSWRPIFMVSFLSLSLLLSSLYFSLEFERAAPDFRGRDKLA